MWSETPNLHPLGETTRQTRPGQTFTGNRRHRAPSHWPSAVRDLDVELQVHGCDHTVALEDSTGLAAVSLVALDDIDGIEHLAVSPVDAPHADQRPQFDHHPLSAGVGDEGCLPPRLQQGLQHQPPPALDDAGAERRMRQHPAPRVPRHHAWILVAAFVFFFNSF